MRKKAPPSLLIALTIFAVAFSFLGSVIAYAPALVAHIAPLSHTIQSQGRTQPRYCQIFIAKLQPGETTSRILSEQCSSQPPASSTTSTQLLGAFSGMQPTLPHACISFINGTLLMRWWTDANHRGSFTDIRGCDGPCDSAGYGISYVGDTWNDKISSFQVFNNCIHTRAYENADFSGLCQAYNGDIDFVGSALNDEISSFRIASVANHC